VCNIPGNNYCFRLPFRQSWHLLVIIIFVSEGEGATSAVHNELREDSKDIYHDMPASL
jgi:hypothetical protein